MIRGKIWGPCWLKIQWQGAAGGAVMGHCICVRERWWWVALKSDGPWSTDGVHCLTTTAVEHNALWATPHTSQRSKLLASNHVEWRPIIVHYPAVATAQKYWSKAYANTMQPHTGGFPCTVQLTHNLHMRWHERGEHNIPAPLWAFFVNDRSDTVSIHGPVIQFIQQLKPIKLGHFWNLNILK